MTRRALALAPVAALALLAACGGAPKPRVIQSTSATEVIRLVPGMATQIELPAGERPVSTRVGDAELVEAVRDGDVVTLTAKGGEGETNVLVRTSGADGKPGTYQYRLSVSPR